jgi:hypothetical protein
MWWRHENFFWDGLVYHVAHSKARAHIDSKCLNLHQRKLLKPPKFITKSTIYLQLILLVMWGHHILIFLLVLSIFDKIEN